MKNILKLCLLLTLCASLLLTVGCAKKDAEGTEGTEGATQGQTTGAADTDATDGTTEAVVDGTVEGNPEGDPFDAAPEDTNNGEGDVEPEPTEPEVDIEEGTDPSEDDFEVDFGDLL